VMCPYMVIRARIGSLARGSRIEGDVSIYGNTGSNREPSERGAFKVPPHRSIITIYGHITRDSTPISSAFGVSGTENNYNLIGRQIDIIRSMNHHVDASSRPVELTRSPHSTAPRGPTL
jgi:hypothetical protein